MAQEPARHSGRTLGVLRAFKAYAQGDERRRRIMRRERLLDAVQRRVGPLVAVEDDGIRYLIDTSDRSEITRWIFTWGRYEEPMMRGALGLIARELGQESLEGRWFADVGANIGSATLCAVRRFGARHVLALEPHPGNFRMLRLNVVANDIEDRVTAMQVAVTDAPGVVRLEESPDNIGDHRIRDGAPPAGELGEEDRAVSSVAATTLDLAAREAGLDPGEAGLVWIDVQGHEARVLAGMAELLAAGVPVVVEYWPYGLRRAGGLDRFHELAASAFSRAFDLGASHVEPQRPTALSPDAIAQIGERLAGPDDFTNLLLLR